MYEVIATEFWRSITTKMNDSMNLLINKQFINLSWYFLINTVTKTVKIVKS